MTSSDIAHSDNNDLELTVQDELTQKIAQCGELTVLGKEAVMIRIENPAWSVTKIAETLNKDRRVISRIFNTPSVMDILEVAAHIRSRQAVSMMLSAQPKAVDKLTEMLEEKDDKRLVADIAKYITKNVLESKIAVKAHVDVDIENKIDGMNAEDCLKYMKDLMKKGE